MKGFVSNLPICEGDEVVMLICRSRYYNRIISNENPYIESCLNPVFLPIYGISGEYDDISQYDTGVTDEISKLMNMSFEDIYNAISKYGGTLHTMLSKEQIERRNIDDKEVFNNYCRLVEKINPYTEEKYDFSLNIIMEHRSVWNTMMNMPINKNMSDFVNDIVDFSIQNNITGFNDLKTIDINFYKYIDDKYGDNKYFMYSNLCYWNSFMGILIGYKEAVIINKKLLCDFLKFHNSMSLMCLDYKTSNVCSYADLNTFLYFEKLNKTYNNIIQDKKQQFIE